MEQEKRPQLQPIVTAANLVVSAKLNPVEARAQLGGQLDGWTITEGGAESEAGQLTLIATPENLEEIESERTSRWNALHGLKQNSDLIERIEPIVELADLMTPVHKSVDLGWLGFGSSPPEDINWATKQINVEGAHKLIRKSRAGEKPGQGIDIAHPDSGIREHTEINHALPNAEGRNFRNDSVPDDGRSPNDAPHGLSTASVILAHETHAIHSDRNLLGVAPHARLIPLRVSSPRPRNFWLSPILTTEDVYALIHAIRHAVKIKAHVVSMSLGTHKHYPELRRAIDEAIRAGLILVAASGNYLGCVIYPARYPEIIALAASNEDRKPWVNSSYDKPKGGNSLIDIAAPGEDVFRATIENGEEIIEHSSGTSYSAALTAGIAALWLQRHGVESLRKKYRAENGAICMQQAFRYVLHKADKAHSIARRYGRGIIDAEAILDFQLPDLAEVQAYWLASLPREPDGDDRWLPDDCIVTFLRMRFRRFFGRTVNMDAKIHDPLLRDEWNYAMLAYIIDREAREPRTADTQRKNVPTPLEIAELSGCSAALLKTLRGTQASK